MKTSTLPVLLLLICFVFGNISSKAQIVNAQSSKAELLQYHLSQLTKGEHQPDQLIVKFTEAVEVDEKSMTTGSPSINSVLSSINTKMLTPVFKKNKNKNARSKQQFGLFSFYILQFENGTDLTTALKTLSELDEIEMVEPNYLARGSTVPNDPLYTQQWALDNTGQAVSVSGGSVGTPGVDLNMEAAWDLNTGSEDVIVCILDTGVDTEHPEFAGRIVPGYDFQFDDDDPNPVPGESGGAHGTACAGIVGASGNNGTGVAGISWETKIMPVKVLYDNSGLWTIIASGITWAADNGADIISMSIGGYSYSSTLEAAVDYAFAAGCTLFASSGNGNLDTDFNPHYPSSFTNTISVGALSPCGERTSPTSCDGEDWWGSNYGTDLDFLAPGTRNYTTDITGSDGYDGGDYYPNFNGTSSACPHAAGVAALMLAENPMLSNTQIRNKMQMSCVDIYDPGKDDESGWGRIDAYEAVLNATNDQPTLRVVPSEWSVIPGQPFSVDFYIENVSNLANYEITCSYESDYFNVVGDSFGDFIYSTGRTQGDAWSVIDPPGGSFTFAQETTGLTPPGPDGNGSLFTVNFVAIGDPSDFGTLQFNITEHTISQPDGTPILPDIINGSILFREDGYCTYALYSEGCVEDYINYVSMTDFVNANSGCSENGYGDFSYLSADVAAGQSYELTLEVGYDEQHVFGWVDFNDDTWFEDSEKVLDNFIIENANEMVSTYISIPGNALLGEHRFRLRSVYDEDVVDPCAEYEFGEVEDYTLNVIPDNQGYCTEDLFYSGCEYGDGIEDFFFEQIFHTQSGCSPNGYGDFTYMSTDLLCGDEVGVEISSGYDSQYVSIWIDFNDDSTFDPDELILDNEFIEEPYEFYYFPVFIPEACQPGEHRMRVRANFADPIFDACEMVDFGEVHDYTVNIIGGQEMGTLQGTVYNRDNDLPQEGIQIFNLTTGTNITTGPDGTYNFGEVPASYNDFLIDQPDYFAIGLTTVVSPGENKIFDFEVLPIHTNSFDIPQGWSGVSSVFYIFRDVDDVFDVNTDDVIIMSSMDGFYYPGQNVNTLGNWEDSPGYKIKASEAFSFDYSGWTRKPAELTLPTGWSILPGWNECLVGIDELFGARAISEPVIVKEIAGPGVYWPEQSVYTLNVLQPGKAYMINMDFETTVMYPDCSFKDDPVISENKIVNNTTWNDPIMTASSHLIHIPGNLVIDAGLTSGDYIGAFDINDNCYGMIQVSQAGNYAIAAFADDQLTSVKDGFAEGDLILLKAFKMEIGEAVELDVEFDQQMPDQQLYRTDGMSSVLLKSTGFANGLVAQNQLVHVYPNPGNGIVNIQITGEQSILGIEAFDTHGKLVLKTQYVENSSGIFKIDIRDMPAGFYSLKIITESTVIEEKIIIQ